MNSHKTQNDERQNTAMYSHKIQIDDRKQNNEQSQSTQRDRQQNNEQSQDTQRR